MICLKNEYGYYDTRRFCDIFPTVEEFRSQYEASALKTDDVTKIDIIYYLLYAEAGNNPISNDDENQFKYRLWSTIFMYGPTWEKRLEVQSRLRALEDSDIFTGGSAIHNHAYNDGGEPTTQTLTEIDYINEQNVTKYKKSKLEGYSILMSLLVTDVTKDFINKFKPLFKTVVAPEIPQWYTDSGWDSALEIVESEAN